MEKITLTRNETQGKAVHGTMTFRIDDQDITVRTLENRDFLIPTGTYELKKTWSPRFKKMLPEVLNVPERSGIRIHRGSIPEHSQGCILTDIYGMAAIDAKINHTAKYLEEDTLQLVIQ
jgi:hypothetical protein